MKNSSRVRRKSWERKLVTLAVASCFAADLYAAPPTPGLPYGPTVINGQVFFNYNGNLLQITNSSGAIINWQAFSIDSGAITRFIQQSASSTVLNRVTSGNPSTILGALQSQLPDGTTGGRVFLINPSGIVFGAGAQVDTGGLVASTLALSNADFLGGRNRFTEVNGAGAVENHGKITTPTGGSIYLIAPSIVNSGIIRSDGGEIVLAAGKSVELVNANSPDLRVTITAPDNQALNLGQIIAQGGKVGIYGGLIRQNGVVNANSAVRGENGKIVFKATKDVSLGAGSSTTASGPTGGSISIQSDTGKATVGGVVEANGTQGKGGTIAIAGQQGVAVEPTARVSANGIEGGSVALTSAAGAVSISAPVTANATLGRAGEVAVTAATTASLASTGQLSASGGQGNGIVSLKGSGGVTLDAGSQVQAKGATGGTVTVQADQGAIMAQGTIDASATEGTGGNVHVAAFSDIALDIGSKILASGRSGGEVKVESREGTLLASGLIDGQGNEGPGGLVWLLAPRVGLIRESVVNVSGLTGGGTVLVGGDYQGNNPDIQNASAVFFGPDSRIVADATQAGDGGRVILWSDDVTRAYGSISVRGGASSGNGGFVETSSHHFLDVTRAPDLAAPFGVGGTWLLDPENVNITNTINSNITAAPTFQPALAGSASNLQDLILRAALVAGGSVVVDTSVFGGGGGGAGNIDVQASAVLTGITAGVGTTLTLKAHNDISINSSITGAGGNALNITLTADQDVSGAGDVSVNAAINTNGGAFNATGVNFGNSTGGTITTGAGLINVNAKGSVALNDAITAGAGTITFLANQNAGANNFTMAAGSSITTANATSSAVAISVNAAGGGTGGAALRDITTGAAGTISVTTATGGNTTGGSITQPAGILTTGVGGSVVLSTPTGGGSSVGTGGANMRTASNIVTANAGSGGVFITETAGSDFTATATGAGDIQITALNGQLNILGDTSTGTGNITLNSVALNITQVGKLVGNVLTTNSVGGTVLNNAANAVSGFSATNATNGDVSLTNTLALDIAAAGITQNVGNLNITNTGAITQTGTISNAGGIATLAAGAANDINLGLGNNFGEVRVTTGKDVTLNDTNAISLGSVSTANNLTVSAVGIMQTASGLTVNGTSTFNGGAGVIALTTATNNLTGAVSLNNSGTNNVQIADANAIVLGASSVGQNLAVTAKGGISQTGALVVPGTSTFTVDTTAAQDVLLAGFDNNLTGAVTIATTGGATLQDVGLRNINGAAAVPTLPASLRNLDLQFTTAAVTLPTINLTGTLNVLAGGPITQAAGGVSVALTSTFNSGANAITLTDILNNFQGAVALTSAGAAGNIAINDANALVLGTVSMGNAASTLTVTTDGAITQNGATTITSGTGLVNINSGATGSAITLTNNNDFRGAVRLTNVGANNIAITDANALVLDTVSMANAAGTLTVTTDGAITQNGATTITSGTGLVNINSGATGSAITLTNNNDFRGAVRLTSVGAAGNIAITDANALQLDTVSMGNAASTLTVTTDGAITQNGATTITSGTGLVNINSGATGSAITLTNNNDFRGAVRLTNVGANNIAITDTNALVLDTVSMANAAGTLTVTTDGAITQNGATTITSGTGLVNINSGATGSAITLTNNNDFRGAVRLTSLGAAGNIAITDANALVLDTVSMGNAGSTLAVVSNGAITQNGATTITSGTGLVNINSGATGSAITLTNNNDFRGAVSLTNVGANNVQIADANAIVLGASSVGQNLAVTAKGGISQTGALVVPGTSTFTVDTTAAQDVLLAGFDNNLTGAVTIATTGGATLQDVGLRNINGAAAVPTLPASLRNLDLQFTTAAVTLPTINLTGTLNVLAGGPITQAAGGVSVALTSTFNSGANAITLTDILNNFQGAVALTTLGAAGNIAITDANALVLGTVSMGNAASTLAVVSNGAITQNGATTITSGTGAVSFNSGAAGNPITLTNNNDFRGAVALTSAGAAGNIAINDVNALVLGTVSMGNAASTLTVTTDGAITQNGATTITSGTGLVNINSGATGSAITLTNNNDFRGAVRLTSVGAAGNIAITDANALQLDTVSMGNAASTLTVTTDGAITQNGATTITSGTGLVNINSGATGSTITLTNNNDFRGAVRLTNVGANNIAITDANALVLDTVSMANAAGTLTVTTDGAITQNGATTITSGTGLVNINSGATGSAITLTNNNDFRGAVRLTSVGAAGNIAITDANALQLDTVSMGNAASTLTVTTDGAITQNGATTITSGTGLVNINSGATGSTITLTNNNDFRGAVRLTNVGANNIAITDANALVLDTVSMANAAGTLTVTTDGAITQNGATTITSGTGLVNINSGATGSAITLTNNNDFRGAVRLTSVSAAGNIAITDANALQLDTVSMGNAGSTLAVVSNGAITQNGATTITSGTGAVSFNSGAAGNPITLTNNNDFRGAVALTSAGAAGNIAINDANALVLGTVSMGNAASTLTVTTDGAITQNGATTITSGTGLVNINSGATGSAITLTNNNDFRGAVRLTNVGANNIAITDANALVLDTVSMANAAGTLTVTTDGAITQNGATTITSGTGLVNINSGATGSAITLTNNNDFRGAVALTSTGAAGNVSINDVNALTMGILSIGHNFTATSTGATTLNGALATGNGGTVTLTNGGLLTISANINADGAVTQNGLGLVDLNADITTTGDAVNFQRAVTLGGAGAARSIDTTNGGGNPFGGNITFQNTVAGGTKDFTLNAGTLGDLLHTGAITGVGNYTLNGSRAATFSSLLTAGGNIILTADELDFNGPADSISTTGGGTLLLQPTSNPFAINIGTTAGGSAASLDLSVSDLLALKDGFSQISIGRAVTGRHVIDIGNATFRDKLLIQSPGPAPSSSITVTGTLNMINNDDVSMDTPGSISGGGLVSGNYFKIIQSGGIGSIATPLQTNVATLEAANSGSGDLVINNAGDVTLINQFRNLASGFELRLSTTNGSINTGTATVASTNGRIILAANDTGAGANITVGSGGITSNGGMIALHAADNITVNGAVSSNSGNIEIIAGASDATFITGLLNGPLTLPATETVVDGNGSISINATVDAGPGAPATRGNIVLISATHDSAPAGTRVPLSTAITQGAGGTLRANNLTAVTLRGTGGQNNGGGSIVLNGATPLNSAANVNLFACAESGCPGPLGGAPFTTAPMIAAIAAPPVGLYADGPLFFTSGTTNISGVGTVNDFVFWGSPVLTVTGGTLFGRKLTFESDGDIIIDLASQITDTNVSMGGVLKFVAGHDINYITPAVETNTFGAAGNPITHGDIQFIASNDIKINNSIYLGNSNTLTLSANQPVSFITPSIALGGPAPNGQPLAASGTGTVTIQAGTATALSDNAAILQAGNVNIGTLLLPVYQLKLLGGTTESLTLTTRQVEHSDAQIKANDALNVFVGAGGLTLAGGTATVTNTATAAAQATANASMESATTILNVTGNVNVNGGNATAAGGLAGLINDVGADASAYINSPLTPGGLTAIIGGNLSATGGTALAGANLGHSLASATLSGATIIMQVGSGITLQGGNATANVGTGSGTCLSTAGVCATAVALISSGTSTVITNANGDIKFTGGNSTANGGAAGTANTIAGLIDHVPSSLATVMEVSTVGGGIKLTGGIETIIGSGDAKSTSTIVSGGGIKLTATGGVILNGASTGLFQSIGSPPTIVDLDGSVPPIRVLGGLTRTTVAGTGNALVSSGAPPSNLDPLAAGLLSSLNALAGAIKLQGLGSLSTSSGSGKPNYCK